MAGETKRAFVPPPDEVMPTRQRECAKAEEKQIGPATKRAMRIRKVIDEGRYRRDPMKVAEAFVIREYFDLE